MSVSINKVSISLCIEWYVVSWSSIVAIALVWKVYEIPKKTIEFHQFHHLKKQQNIRGLVYKICFVGLNLELEKIEFPYEPVSKISFVFLNNPKGGNFLILFGIFLSLLLFDVFLDMNWCGVRKRKLHFFMEFYIKSTCNFLQYCKHTFKFCELSWIELSSIWPCHIYLQS